MSFTDAVRTALSKYATFTGRATRAEYWWFALFNVLCSIAANVLDVAAGTQVFSLATLALLFVPNISVTVRRLHDTGRSGWNLLWFLIPVVGWVLCLVWMLQPSKPEAALQYA